MEKSGSLWLNFSARFFMIWGQNFPRLRHDKLIIITISQPVGKKRRTSTHTHTHKPVYQKKKKKKTKKKSQVVQTKKKAHQHTPIQKECQPVYQEKKKKKNEKKVNLYKKNICFYGIFNLRKKFSHLIINSVNLSNNTAADKSFPGFAI